MPSTSNTIPQGGMGGTPGGRPNATTRAAGSVSYLIGEVGYLWVLVIIEVLLMGWLRNANRRHHGG